MRTTYDAPLDVRYGVSALSVVSIHELPLLKIDVIATFLRSQLIDLRI